MKNSMPNWNITDHLSMHLSLSVSFHPFVIYMSNQMPFRVIITNDRVLVLFCHCNKKIWNVIAVSLWAVDGDRIRRRCGKYLSSLCLSLELADTHTQQNALALAGVGGGEGSGARKQLIYIIVERTKHADQSKRNITRTAFQTGKDDDDDVLIFQLKIERSIVVACILAPL